jgi:fructosamine-3-kinase
MSTDNVYKAYAEMIFAYHGLDTECVPACEGVINNVFLSKSTVVRMPRETNMVCNFPGEKWAIERVREKGVPAPRVLAVDMSKSSVPVPYMIVERLPGKRVSESSPEMCRELGEVLARIHAVKTVGYGKVGETGIGPKVDWKANIDMKRSMLPALAKIDPSLVVRAESVYDDLENCPQPPCLVHGDYGLHNMLFSEGKLSGLFDFAGRSDSSHYDIGDLFLRAPDAITHFEEGYGKPFDYHLALLYAAANAASKLPFMQKVMPVIAVKTQKSLDEILKKLGK